MKAMKAMCAKITYNLAKEPVLLSISGSVEGMLGFNANDFLNDSVKFHEMIHIDDEVICAALFSPIIEPSLGTCTLLIW